MGEKNEKKKKPLWGNGGWWRLWAAGSLYFVRDREFTDAGDLTQTLGGPGAGGHVYFHPGKYLLGRGHFETYDATKFTIDFIVQSQDLVNRPRFGKL